ncbi:type II toxin-antitoxin system prevent-host-death family antitoxin [Microbacterium paraoxydans]|uniref:Antitoxin n=1 Tax=Microbacterium paraoxydans TaxID=199592 RepID=A0ABS5IID2_9MICO|nr:type II toxin-antitoxin system prevent-host-death family antitoxin [Microbacterium paraoxydans]MBS0022729.1 type II toxin-antitoxin system Phd/YefM family antitoxin [Microbacterium paraoxydans]
MTLLSRSISSKDLRDGLSDVLGGVAYGSERIGVTRHGKLTAVVISVADLELLEELEAARDAAEFTAAKAADDGERVSLDHLRAELS